SVSSTSVWPIAACGENARSWRICRMLARSSAMTAVSRASAPGTSRSRTPRRTRRPSFTRPRSMMRASVVTSMLPPETTSATRRPSRSRPQLSSAASGAAPAPSHGDEHGLHIGQLFEQLQPERALAGDDPRIVERMDEELAALGAERPRQLVGLVEVASIQDHLGAVPARRGYFDERRVLGHDDRGGNVEPLGVEGDGKTVVAGAGGDDARAPRVG